ncbi:RNAse III [Orenia metallireducens]|uniref:Ribonuclease 3 n=1 Tax=Orenia metallireducens TaxID=1413210 RepID=A0A285HFW9_9FIRM|nr:ribonuclease III [Orenia metallireducens]PRX27460.1 RNAse III [Orenia metallireducens]SNY34578.1 RNAse III [Orenia metallireducens]
MTGYNKGLEELQQQLGIFFNDLELLQRAVTHKSYANENRHLGLKDNERLEFLGDSIQDLVVSEYMFIEYPNHPEGELAKIRSVVVSAPVLAEKAKEINLGKYLLLGKGEEMTGGRDRDSILADAFEALVGSIYLDQGLEIIKGFILELLIPDIKLVERGEHIQDYKTLLQELVQKNSNLRPEYEVVKEEGPDHNKRFTIQVNLEERVLGVGAGSSKKEAEQKAAEDAINKV